MPRVFKKQSYTNCEFILVDNGSSDSSIEIAKRFCTEDTRFKLYEIDKRGASIARNSGLDLARGEYLTFVDSDDWVEPNYIEAMLEDIEKNQADLAVCDFYTGDKPTANWSDETFMGVF